jgi:acyl-coenzyme A thioesterase PaaI-like protein
MPEGASNGTSGSAIERSLNHAGDPASRRLGDAIRRLMALAVDSDRSPTQQLELAEAVEKLSAGDPTPTSRYSRSTHLDVIGTHPLLGGANPVAPPLHFERDGEFALARVTYPAVYEGIPGNVHGGHIAAGFDVALGFAAAIGGAPSVTGTLTLRYRRPTPTNTPLEYRARLERQERRKLFVVGTLTTPDGNVTVEGDAIFIAVEASRFTTIT